MSYFIILFCILFIDQISKFFVEKNLYGKSIEVIDNIFSLTYVQNRGAAWGILNDNRLILMILIPIFLAIIIWYFIFINRNKYERVLGSLIVGGAISNYIDRIFRGYVVDFFDFKIWPVFNLADVAIVIGSFLMILFLILKGGEKNGEG